MEIFEPLGDIIQSHEERKKGSVEGSRFRPIEKILSIGFNKKKLKHKNEVNRSDLNQRRAESVILAKEKHEMEMVEVMARKL